MSEERRGEVRTTRPIMMRYRRLDEPHWHSGPVRDLSCTGARLMSDVAIEPGEWLELWIGLPLFVEPIGIKARVMWKKTAFSGRMSLPELGIAFHELDPSLQHAIDEAIRHFLMS